MARQWKAKETTMDEMLAQIYGCTSLINGGKEDRINTVEEAVPRDLVLDTAEQTLAEVFGCASLNDRMIKLDTSRDKKKVRRDMYLDSLKDTLIEVFGGSASFTPEPRVIRLFTAKDRKKVARDAYLNSLQQMLIEVFGGFTLHDDVIKLDVTREKKKVATESKTVQLPVTLKKRSALVVGVA